MIDQAQPEIVITARALPPARAEGDRGVVVIGREALERTAGSGLDQLVRDVGGVQLFRRSDSRSANPTTQGITARGLGGNAASRALVLLDGVPQGDPFGGWINWPGLDAIGLAEVRVSRGGGAIGDGPGALAGTIDLVSDRSPGARARIEGSARGAGELRFAANAGGASLAAWGGNDPGFVPVVAEDRGPADRRAPFSFGGLRAGLRVGAVEFGTSLFGDQRNRGLALTDNQSLGADAFARWRRDNATILVFHQRRRLDSDFASASADRSNVTANLRQRVPAQASGWSATWQVATGPFELRVGSDGRIARGRSVEEASFVAGVPTRSRDAGGRQATAGAFAEASAALGGLILSGGIRVDRWWFADLLLEERNRDSGALLLEQRSDDRSGWEPSGKVGARASLSSRWALRGSLYSNWRLPTLNELVRPFRVGRDAVAANPELANERLRGAEIGVERQGDRFRLSATLFANRLAAPITNVTRGTGPGKFPGVGFVAGTFRRRENIGALRSVGLEADAGWRSGDWRVEGSLALVRARNSDSGPLDGLRPAQVPSVSASAGVGWRGLGLAVRHVGAQNEDDLGTLRLPAATTLDASANWPIGRGFGLRLRAENLTNARVFAATTADGVDERATPRRLWLGLSLSR